MNSNHFKFPAYKDLVAKVEEKKDNFPDLKTEYGYLYRKAEHLTGEQVHDEYAWKLWLPSELIPKVIFQNHNSLLASHGGIHKTVERVRRYYRLVPDVKSYVNARETCKSTKPLNHVLRPPLAKAPEAVLLFQRIFIDFLGRVLINTYILT